MIENGKKYIVEARIAWTDCREYCYVYGECSIHDAEKEVGFNLKRTENWLLKVKGEKGTIIIPGCRVGALMRTDETPVNTIETLSDTVPYYVNRPVSILVL